jgi:hypothetical protein
MTSNNNNLLPVAEQFIITERETQTPLTFQDLKAKINELEQQS